MTYKIPVSVLVVIHTADLEVLLIERAGQPGFWQSVTGSIDAVDEPLSQAATRELFEETGIVADGQQIALLDWRLSNSYEIYPIWRHRYAPGVIHNTEHVFSVRVPRDTVITLSAREHLRYVWLPHLAAADQCFSSSNAEAILQLPAITGIHPGLAPREST
ncbi:dihydroneopterin triphosphate diphosphatase [Janthinobacterium sp. PC23-8]|uniref:dihydroneopterin triphosphate diphosphatase n=1 Tax=Janthinobacterium sp. PC23-8 TaxID=2012679 RepID=UPI000B95E3B5|nr:dihydroneopterin triphosphate diphosphatase [Janthinobacterium sp. PC23-8]OYO31973.1 dihydroneopterin triphosphate diphosphatase [Janthinobacterium sp. PC23-8]